MTGWITKLRGGNIMKTSLIETNRSTVAPNQLVQIHTYTHRVHFSVSCGRNSEREIDRRRTRWKRKEEKIKGKIIKETEFGVSVSLCLFTGAAAVWHRSSLGYWVCSVLCVWLCVLLKAFHVDWTLSHCISRSSVIIFYNAHITFWCVYFLLDKWIAGDV